MARLQWTLLPISDFDQLAAHWDRLNDDIGGAPFHRSSFIRNLLREFSSGSERLAVGRAGGTIHAAGILVHKRFGVWETFQPSQLPLGAWLMPSKLSFAECANSLMHSLPGVPLLVCFTQQDPRFHQRPADAGNLRTVDYIETAWVDVDRPFDKYWECRGKNLRTNLRKVRAKLETEGTSIALEVMAAPSDVSASIARYGQLEHKGWKAGIGTAVDPATPQGRFYDAMMREFCAAGEGEIWQLRLSERVVAMDLCIRRGDMVLILKTAYDPDFRAVSPAFLLKQEAFQRLFSDGQTRRIEFYGRRMEWHTRWTDNVRTLYHVNAYRWPIVLHVRNLLRKFRRDSAVNEPPREATSADAG